MVRKLWLAPLALTAAFSLSCGSSDPADEGGETPEQSTCEKETRHRPFTAGMPGTMSVDDLTVSIESASPAPPTVGDNSWTLRVADAGGNPVEGASIAIERWMPDHDHGGVKPIVVTEVGGGLYEASPVNFNMDGFWRVTVTVSQEKELGNAVFPLCVE